MLCSELQLVKSFMDHDEIKPLPCNRWSCDHCAPKRRRKLIAIAMSGKPTSFLTLTVNPAIGTSPLDRRNMLHDAWKRLVKRILRQFALAPEKRWTLKTTQRQARAAAITAAITARTPRLTITKIHYMAFLERTKLDEPHLHVLLRAPYIPQDWISEQMAEMTGSPIVDIRQIKTTMGAVSYVTKYVTKAPAQFGNTKRYWISKGWEVNKPDANKEKPVCDRKVTVRLVQYDEWRQSAKQHGDILKPMPDGWIAVWPRGTAWEKWGNFTEPLGA